jgi:hypothetical protein
MTRILLLQYLQHFGVVTDLATATGAFAVQRARQERSQLRLALDALMIQLVECERPYDTIEWWHDLLPV